ncbi:LptF/LptG family permease [Caminibacter mediatlanticus]|uniref:LptF/LptG family permease n=1 Tax=Caminibacter mediatlanticus TB-2 TaxID=391592 RepID=A0AAI9F1V7_9BACT|nr:LptF/LptG family permease [Caminibacter mediatlanticus]EDM24107.1 hypothetical protein CMTB2_07626 [Caminibacter mediatlanticus TB-2]
MYFWYILRNYLKNFVITLIGFALLFVLVDYSFNFAKLPNSSNLQTLYIFYVFIDSIFILYPLALVFAFLLTLNKMIKFNELVSFYSLGFKPFKILKPIIYFSLFFFILIMYLQSTKIAYVNQYAKAIKNNMQLKNKNLFLKYNNSVVYIKELNPILKEAYDVKIFVVKDNKLIKIIYTKKAKFFKNHWISNKAVITTLSKDRWDKEEKKLVFLENFKPKILSNLKTLNTISLSDAYIAIKYFKDIDLNRVLSIVFFKVFTPLSLIILIILFFYTSPIHIRISNVSIFMIKSISLTIFVWGVELLLFKFTKQGVMPYYVIALPFFILIILTFLILRRYK